MKLSKKPVI